MRTLAALGVIAMLAVSTTAQEEKKISLAAYSTPTAEVIADFCDQGGLHLNAEFENGEANCVVVADDLSPGGMAELLSFATGQPMRVSGSSLIVGEVNGGVVKGYDVSVLAGAYVEYVNNYGAPKEDNPLDELDLEERTAAEYLAESIEYLLHHPYRPELLSSVVGDRILLTLPPEDHARVREFLDLLMKEGGGESGELLAERAMLAKLADTRFKGDFTGTPISSIVIDICRKAGLNVALGAGLASAGADWHIDFVVKQEVTALEAFERLTSQLAGQDYELSLACAIGAAVVEITDLQVWSGYRVYDIGNLLKKLNASYQRQRTAPDKDGGFEGDLKQAGGNRVIEGAVFDQLEQQGLDARVEAFGSRLVVRGSAGSVDAATTILKEMGWEAPKE